MSLPPTGMPEYKAYPPTAVETKTTSFVFAVHVLNHVLNRTLDKATGEVSGVNARIILFIAHNNEHGLETYQSDIKSKFSITRSTCSRVITLMEEKGLLTRDSETRDGRSNALRLTKKSQAFVAHFTEVAQEIEDQMMKGIDDGTSSLAAQTMQKMLDNLKEIDKKN